MEQVSEGRWELPLQKMENHQSAPLPQSLLGNVITMITDTDSDGKRASQGRPPQPDSTITGSSHKTGSSFTCDVGNVLFSASALILS